MEISLSLCPLFTNHAVLQRDHPIAIWGRAPIGQKVNVQLARQKKSTHADDAGKWKVEFDAMSAGGPHELKVTSGRKSLVFEHILMGDVWVCSGQSNMARTVRGCIDAIDILASAGDANLRLFNVPNGASFHPLRQLGGKWSPSDATTVGDFSAIAYHFGTILRRELDVPIGLINVSCGGTCIETWMNRESFEKDRKIRPILRDWEERRQREAPPSGLDQFPQTWRQTVRAWIPVTREAELETFDPTENAADDDAAARLAASQQPEINYNQPTLLFNHNITPLLGLGMRGVIWYQGETNAVYTLYSSAFMYRELFSAMIQGWREAWGIGLFPFLFVQLPNFRRKDDPHSHERWPILRESQSKALALPNTGMVVTVDIGDPNDLHPQNKSQVGRRLAQLALGKIYKQDVIHTGPVFDSIRIVGNKIRLIFKESTGGLAVRGTQLTGFTIASADGPFVTAKAKIDGDTVLVWSDKVPEPAEVRYGWDDAPACNLHNLAGLPAQPFRTDTRLVDGEDV